MRGQKLIGLVDRKLLDEVSRDYKNLVLKNRIKQNLLTVGQISAEIILVAGVFAGAFALAAMGPNVIGAVGGLIKNKKSRPLYFKCGQKEFSRALTYLKNRHLIEVLSDTEGTRVKLTKRGIRRYSIHLTENMVILKPRRWDRCWRIVVFDIPEKFKIAREALRQKLQNLGFFQIQKSVFVIPYPCEKEINFIRYLFGLEDQIRLINASYFQGEEVVSEHFGLI